VRAIWFFLMRRYAREGVEPSKTETEDGTRPEPTLSFAY
jgi:hypothetical protein